ncbi:alginate lyase family protein [Algibacter sp. 2305UL17-15]|uniref:alginate lyase family protein n=1 Tax=Algibacter sp. 2305UL17-15 TaxID=3231268 RepID=UPI003458B77C
MDSNKVKLLIHTVKYLRFKQVYYRLYYFIRHKFFKKTYDKQLQINIEPLVWDNFFHYQNSFSEHNTFTFLNISHQFDSDIDWNFNEHGKLWAYNLNYFEYLNQETLSKEDGLKLIKDYVKNDTHLKDGKEPYPISLRGINWIKFLSTHKISDKEINQYLYNHYQLLSHNLEYHLLGNHLLENGYALLFGAYYFKDGVLYKKAKHILLEELKEQVLSDGAHFELSPMYHQILLHRLLDCINLIKKNPQKEDELFPFLIKTAVKMLSWLQVVTYKNGNIPMVNDSAYGIAAESKKLFAYAESLNLQWKKALLSDSGYRKIENNIYELFLDVGHVGPKYQPGHAHSDTFSFELYVNEKPIIVDTGVSTYEKNEQRQIERSTASHNTVKIGDYEQTDVWGGFRVAKRAKIIKLKESEGLIEASHDGYKKLNILHTRSFSAKKEGIEINDSLSASSQNINKSYLHLHHSIEKLVNIGNTIKLINENITISFSEEVSKIDIIDYHFPLGYNKIKKAKKIEVSFGNALKTEIDISKI